MSFRPSHLRMLGLATCLLPFLAISPVAARNSWNNIDLDQIVTGTDLATVTALAERQGLTVNRLDEDTVIPVWLIQRPDGGIIALFGFLGCADGTTPGMSPCPVLRVASLDFKQYYDQSESVAANASFENANVFNMQKIGNPFLFFTEEGGLFLRSDINLSARVTLNRVDYHFAEFTTLQDAAVNFLASGAGGLIASLPEMPTGASAFSAALAAAPNAVATAEEITPEMAAGLLFGTK